MCGEAPYVGKTKNKLRYRFSNYKIKHRAFRKGNTKMPQKCVHDLYCLDIYLQIDDWDFTPFKQCATYKQIKQKKIFWPNQLKTFLQIRSE